VDNELEVIRDEMEQTRAKLADKLGALETQVRETVSGATDAVNSTVEGVKDVVSTVSETVESVTETFNVSKQVEQHPWMALGAAVATGFVLAQVIGRSSQPAAAAPQPSQSYVPPPTPQPSRSEQPPQQEESGIMDSLESMLPDSMKDSMKGAMNTAVSALGGLAVGGLMGVIRELAATGLPQEWKGDVTKMIDQVTTQLGGKPMDAAHSTSLMGLLGLAAQDQGGQQGNGGSQEQARQQSVQGGSQAGDVGGNYRGFRGVVRQPVGR